MSRIDGTPAAGSAGARDHPLSPWDELKTILVAIDGSLSSVEASDFAVELAAEHRAELIFVHVVPTLDLVADEGYDVDFALPHEPTQHDRALLDRAAELAKAHDVVATRPSWAAQPRRKSWSTGRSAASTSSSSARADTASLPALSSGASPSASCGSRHAPCSSCGTATRPARPPIRRPPRHLPSHQKGGHPMRSDIIHDDVDLSRHAHTLGELIDGALQRFEGQLLLSQSRCVDVLLDMLNATSDAVVRNTICEYLTVIRNASSVRSDAMCRALEFVAAAAEVQSAFGEAS
jgi:hypothetical protein